MKKILFAGLLAVLTTLTGCVQENWSDVIIALSVQTGGATFSDDYSDVDYVKGVYEKALLATGRVDVMEAHRYFIARRQPSSEAVETLVKGAMDSANEELKDYQTKNRSKLKVVLSFSYSNGPEKEFTSRDFGMSYTEADVTAVEAQYYLQMTLTAGVAGDEASVATFKDMIKSYAVCYYDVEADKEVTKSFALDETCDLKMSAAKLKKAGMYWYFEPKEEGKLPEVNFGVNMTMKEQVNVTYKDGRKEVIDVITPRENADFHFQPKHIEKLCSTTDRTSIQGNIYSYLWSDAEQTYARQEKE